MDPRVKSTSDVIQASHIVVKQGCFPTRIVLRETEGKLITHMEVLQGDKDADDSTGTGLALKHRDFLHGHYFDYNHGPVTWLGTREQAFEKARVDFKERVAKL